MSTKLKKRQSELAIEIDALQTEAAEKRFEITFDNVKSIKTVQEIDREKLDAKFAKPKKEKAKLN